MKVIYERTDGRLIVLTPVEGERLAWSITLDDGTVLPERERTTPIQVDRILRGWPVAGATADWAETEDEFIRRVADKDVPTSVPYRVVPDTDVPASRALRDAWTADFSSLDGVGQ